MYTKLFARITESSLMEESIETRYVFMALLAISDPEGNIIGTDVAISRRINVEQSTFEACMVRLMAPDPHSNSMVEDGKRVILSDIGRGYKLVNFLKYRNTRDEDARKEYMKNYMRDYMREKRHPEDVKQSESNKSLTKSNEFTVKPVKQCLAHSDSDSDSEAYSERDGECKGGKPPDPPPYPLKPKKIKFIPPTDAEAQFNALKIGIPEKECEKFLAHYRSCGWVQSRGKPIKDWVNAMIKWKLRFEEECFLNGKPRTSNASDQRNSKQSGINRNEGTYNNPEDYSREALRGCKNFQSFPDPK